MSRLDVGAVLRPAGDPCDRVSPTTTLQMVAVDDIGAFAALAFEHPGQWKNRTFSLAGDELSIQQIADAFSCVTAQDVKYVHVSGDQFEKNMGRELTVMYLWFEEKGFHFNIGQGGAKFRSPTPSIDGWKCIGTRLPLRRGSPYVKTRATSTPRQYLPICL